MEPTPDYSDITQEEFDEKLEEILSRMDAGGILAIPGVYEAVSEHLNNEVLEELRPEEDAPKVPDDDECDG